MPPTQASWTSSTLLTWYSLPDSRTYDIQTRLNKLVVEHFQSGYIFSFKDGRKDKVELYNVNKTTPKPRDQQYRHLQTSQQTGYQYFLEPEVSRFSFSVSHIFIRTKYVFSMKITPPPFLLFVCRWTSFTKTYLSPRKIHILSSTPHPCPC